MLKKWYEVYSGNDEKKFFVGADGKSGLVRSTYDFRSLAALAKESGLTKEKVERIVQKYVKMGLVIASTNNDNQYGYWQRVAPHLANAVVSVAKSDQDERTHKASKKSKP